MRVIRVYLDRLNDLLLIDHDAARDRKFPVRISVGLFDVDAEVEIHLLQLVTKSVNEIKLFGVRIVLVVENFKRQFFRFD